MQVVGSMVSEIILCVKEVNQKTRTAAYELLVSLAKAMHEQHPPPMPPLGGGQDADMDTGLHLHCCSCLMLIVVLAVSWSSSIKARVRHLLVHGDRWLG